MDNQLVTDLKAARKLIEKPEGWTRGAYARNSEGNKTNAQNPSAVCFCMLGACDRAENRVMLAHEWSRIAEVLTGHLPKPYFHITAFNDDPKTTHEDVLAVFDKAIAAASTN